MTCALAINDYCTFAFHFASDDATMAACLETILSTSHADTPLVLGQTEPSSMEIKITALSGTRAETAHVSTNINLWQKVDAPTQYLKGRFDQVPEIPRIST